jgi:hypothetical protein
MSTSTTKTARGLLLPIHGVDSTTLFAASSITQAGPKPGVPVAQQPTEMVMEASGTQAASTTMQVKCQQSGMPSVDGGGRFAWKYSTDSATQFRADGSPGHKGISGFEALDYTTTADRWHYPNAIRLANDTMLLLCTRGQDTIVAWTKAPDAAAWTSSVLYSYAATSSQIMSCGLQLPNGRILAFFGDATNIISSYSDDNGATWTISTHVISGDVGVSLTGYPTTRTTKRMRCAYMNGQILLVIHTLDGDSAQSRDRLFQYASVTLGATWDYVDATTGYVTNYVAATNADQNTRGFHDIVVIGGQAMICYLKGQPTATFGEGGLYNMVLGNAYQGVQSLTETPMFRDIGRDLANITAVGVIDEGDLVASVDETGMLVFIVKDGANNRAMLYGESTRGLATSTSDLTFYELADLASATKYYNEFAGAHQLGRLVVAHGFKSPSDTHDESLLVTYVGGYTSLQRHPTTGNTALYSPFYLPESVATTWTRTDVLTPTVTLANAALNIVCNAINESVTWQTPSTLYGKVYIDAKCTTTGVGSGAFIRARFWDGVSSYSVKVRFSQLAFVVSDDNGGTLATVAAAAAVAGTGIQIMLTVGSSYCRVFWRASNLAVKSDADQLWQDLGLITGLVNGGASTSVAQFGADSSPVLAHTHTTDVKTVSVGGTSVIEDITQTNPVSLFGRCLASTPQYVDGGLRLRAAAGPGFYNDLWYISTAYTYGAENVCTDVSPSPSTTWRTLSNTAQNLRFDLPEVETYHEPTRVFALALFNINYRTAFLDGWNGAAWVRVLDVNSAFNQSGVRFARTGSTLTGVFGSGSVPGTNWFTYNALAGSHVRMTDASTAITVTRRIRSNTEGGLGSACAMQCVMQLEDVVNTDPTGAGVADTMEILSKNTLTLCTSISPGFTRFRLNIPVQTVAGTYFETGTMVAGTLAVFGTQYSRGRAVASTQNTQLTTARNGSRVGVNLGPARRSVEFAWVDGINTMSLFTAAPDPDYINFAGVPTAAPADTAYKVAGIVDEARGADALMVYVPFIQQYTAFLGAQLNITDMNQFFLCRAVSDVRVESILGNEKSNELVQVATVTLEEEV